MLSLETFKIIITIAGGISTIIAVIVTIHALALKIYKSRSFVRNSLIAIDNVPVDSRSAIVLKDLEIIKQFKKRGIPYMEESVREMLFWLHEQLKGKITYTEIALTSNFVHLDMDDKIVVTLPSEHKILNYFIIGVSIFFGLILSLIVFIITGGYFTTTQDSLQLISQCLLIAYIFFMLTKMYTPIRNAKKLIKIMEDKEYIYTSRNITGLK
jgi:hypothetical protein